MTDVSAGFRPPCWCPSRWAPTWRLHTNLYKFGKNASRHIFSKKNCCDLNLGESLCISTFFLFPDSRLNRLNGFYFLFWSISNGVTLKTSNFFCFVQLHEFPYGLAVRIPGFHPGGPGLTPGMGTHFLSVQNFEGVFLIFYQSLRLVTLNLSKWNATFPLEIFW